MKIPLLLAGCVIASVGAAQKVAVTFDDLPLHGDLHRRNSRPDCEGLRRHPECAACVRSLGIHERQEPGRNTDAAEALKVWVRPTRLETIIRIPT